MDTAIVFVVAILVSAMSVARTAVSGLPRAKVECGEAISKAEARTKQITSPAFPQPFPGDSKCIWAIYAENGKRIRMEFQVFKLLPSVLGKCEHHYVIVKSPFSSHSMGPFCGEIGLPTIVSTGNLIYVELHTVKPVDTDNYQGFKLAFKVTVESSSYELRADNSADDDIVTVDPATMNILSPTAPTAVVRSNRSPRPTTKPWRFRPSRRSPTQVRRTNYGASRRRPVPTVRYPAISYRNKLQSAESRVIMPTPEAATVNIEIIIAIAASAVVAIVIVITIAVLYTKKRNRKPADEASRSGNECNPKIEKQIPEVKAYPTVDPVHYAHEYPNCRTEYPNSYVMAPIATEYYQDKKIVSSKSKSRTGDAKPKRKRRKRRTRQ